MSDTKPNWDFAYSPDTTFASESFAEGVSRRAYRAMRWTPPEKWGQKAVVKEYKDRYSWAQGDWDTAVSTYKKAKDLADRFNVESRTKFPIQIVDYDIQPVIVTSDSTTRPKLGEWVMVEDFLEGDFQKYISNSGWVKPQCFSEHPSMPAFAHWSWVHTKGSLMVCDLQGVRYDSKYVLTDPAILSLEGSYGNTDLSLVGMGQFFSSHQCTDVCRSLGIVHKRPDMSQIQRFMNSEFGCLVQMATTYFPKEISANPPVVSITFSQVSPSGLQINAAYPYGYQSQCKGDPKSILVNGTLTSFSGSTISVSFPSCPSGTPISVYYAWLNYPCPFKMCSVYSGDLPAPSFHLPLK
ncbi:hypothetical protein EMCRGX_G028839 [Ephydatia muelleri]